MNREGLLLRQKIKERCRRLGISQGELAKRADIYPSRLSGFLSGKADIYSSVLTRILKELGLDISLLLDEKGSREADSFSVLFRQMPTIEQENAGNLLRKISSLRRSG